MYTLLTAAAGAAIGAIAGPAGIAIGAAVGALIAGIIGILGVKAIKQNNATIEQKKEQLENLENEINNIQNQIGNQYNPPKYSETPNTMVQNEINKPEYSYNFWEESGIINPNQNEYKEISQLKQKASAIVQQSRGETRVDYRVFEKMIVENFQPEDVKNLNSYHQSVCFAIGIKVGIYFNPDFGFDSEENKIKFCFLNQARDLLLNVNNTAQKVQL